MSITIIHTFEEYDKLLQENEDRNEDKEFKWFLNKSVYEQFVYVQDHQMSNNFITCVYSKVAQRVRDNIMKVQTLTEEGFNKIDKKKINWGVFCGKQRLATNINIVREYADFLDWTEMSRRCDLPLELVREFRNRFDWKLVAYWNGSWRSKSVFHKKEYKKEFEKYFR